MFTKLLVPLDRSSLAEQAVGHASSIARACHAGVDVVLVHEVEQFSNSGDEPTWTASQLQDEEHYVRDIANELASGASVSTTHAVLRGDVVGSISTRAREVDADLIVMTSHGRTGLSRAWLGSVADGVIRHSAIPVLLLRPVKESSPRLTPRALFHKMLLLLDGSAEALGVLEAASALARCSSAPIMLLRVVRPVPFITTDSPTAFIYPSLMPDDAATASVVDEARHQLAEVARMLAERGCADVEQHVVVADRVAQALLDFSRAHGADLVAMSTHGRGASRLAVGSMADKVVRASGLPMLLYRPPTASSRT